MLGTQTQLEYSLSIQSNKMAVGNWSSPKPGSLSPQRPPRVLRAEDSSLKKSVAVILGSFHCTLFNAESLMNNFDNSAKVGKLLRLDAYVIVCMMLLWLFFQRQFLLLFCHAKSTLPSALEESRPSCHFRNNRGRVASR